MKIIINLTKEEYDNCVDSCLEYLPNDPTEKQINEQIIENVMIDPYDYEIEVVIEGE